MHLTYNPIAAMFLAAILLGMLLSLVVAPRQELQVNPNMTRFYPMSQMNNSPE